MLRAKQTKKVIFSLFQKIERSKKLILHQTGFLLSLSSETRVFIFVTLESNKKFYLVQECQRGLLILFLASDSEESDKTQRLVNLSYTGVSSSFSAWNKLDSLQKGFIWQFFSCRRTLIWSSCWLFASVWNFLYLKKKLERAIDFATLSIFQLILRIKWFDFILQGLVPPPSIAAGFFIQRD